MKLCNKRTRKIGDFHFGYTNELCVSWQKDDGFWEKQEYNSLAELNEEWEDVPEEPKEYWFIDYDGGIVPFNRNKETATDNLMKQIGNYFETREEAEKAVEKLKAWKRLKDKGFKIDLWDYDGGNYQERIRTGRILFRVKDYEESYKDLNICFGGKDETN